MLININLVHQRRAIGNGRKAEWKLARRSLARYKALLVIHHAKFMEQRLTKKSTSKRVQSESLPTTVRSGWMWGSNRLAIFFKLTWSSYAWCRFRKWTELRTDPAGSGPHRGFPGFDSTPYSCTTHQTPPFADH